MIEMAAQARDWYSIPEAARFLNVSERVVRKLINDSMLSAYKVGRCIRIRNAELIAFLQNAQMGGSH
jgi:excisionase family DNA binding protein